MFFSIYNCKSAVSLFNFDWKLLDKIKGNYGFYLIGTDEMEVIDVNEDGPELRFNLSNSSSALLFFRSCCVYKNLFHSSILGWAKCYIGRKIN